MARKKTGAKNGSFTVPVGKKFPSQARNYGRKRIMVMNGRGQKRMHWLDEYESK